jgi:hypothetical protein
VFPQGHRFLELNEHENDKQQALMDGYRCLTFEVAFERNLFEVVRKCARKRKTNRVVTYDIDVPFHQVFLFQTQKNVERH